jgi:hypothetical protein
VPSALPHLSRRRLLIGSAALAALGATSVACGSKTPPPDVSALTAQLERARSDSQLAAGAASSAPPPVATALTAVAAERSAHAEALAEEITRITGASPTSSTSSTAASPSASTSAPTQPPAPPTPGSVVAALRQSADGAAQAAAKETGYAAGLLGSVAASCTAAFSVALAGVAP